MVKALKYSVNKIPKENNDSQGLTVAAEVLQLKQFFDSLQIQMLEKVEEKLSTKDKKIKELSGMSAHLEYPILLQWVALNLKGYKSGTPKTLIARCYDFGIALYDAHGKPLASGKTAYIKIKDIPRMPPSGLRK